MVHGRIMRNLTVLVFSAAASIATAAPKIEAVPGEFIVKVKNANVFKSASVLQLFNAEKVRPVLEKENLFLVKRNRLEKESYALSSLGLNPNVVLVSPNYIYRIDRTPNDPKLVELWGLRNTAEKSGRAGIDISAEAAWDIQTGSRDVVVAVIDTGFDYTHPDLKDNAWTNDAEKNGTAGVDDDNNGYVDDIYGYDFANDDADPMDDHGHGSHCSGTIGAKGDDNKGIVGVSWNVRIMGVKFLTAEGSGTLEGAVKAIDYATKMGAHIESNSWGGGGPTEILEEAIKRARDANVLFTAAAGNDSNDNDATAFYPSTYDIDNIVSVAAVDNAGNLAYFSNYGKTTVHVAAPGVDVTSSVPLAINPTGYDSWSGTSMATPHVSGIAALLKAQNPNATYAELKAKLIASSRTLGSLRNKVVSSGITNAFYALSGETPPLDTEDPYNWSAQDYSASTSHPYVENEKAEFTVTVEGANAVSVYFERFETERGYDIVEFKDSTGKVVAKWSGNHDGEFSPVVLGNTMIISFKADDTVNGHGFDITKAAFR
jgi:thermitase